MKVFPKELAWEDQPWQERGTAEPRSPTSLPPTPSLSSRLGDTHASSKGVYCIANCFCIQELF
jgi:hypothetical protein